MPCPDTAPSKTEQQVQAEPCNRCERERERESRFELITKRRSGLWKQLQESSWALAYLSQNEMACLGVTSEMSKGQLKRVKHVAAWQNSPLNALHVLLQGMISPVLIGFVVLI